MRRMIVTFELIKLISFTTSRGRKVTHYLLLTKGRTEVTLAIVSFSRIIILSQINIILNHRACSVSSSGGTGGASPSNFLASPLNSEGTSTPKHIGWSTSTCFLLKLFQKVMNKLDLHAICLFIHSSYQSWPVIYHCICKSVSTIIMCRNWWEFIRNVSATCTITTVMY